MRRLISLMLILCLLAPAALADELSLLTADTVEEVEQFLILPNGREIPAAEAGKIRFVSLNSEDGAFLTDFWKSDRFDLTTKGYFKADYNNMHNRAVYCMALSYLGVDVTPVMMSELAGSRDVTAPYDTVTAKLGNIQRVKPAAYVFDTMVENCLNDPTYSPMYVQIRKPNGALHTVLVVGYIPETGGFIICDPAAPVLDGKNLHAYKMAWHVMRQVVLSSAFYDAFYASEVVAMYQWRLVEN